MCILQGTIRMQAMLLTLELKSLINGKVSPRYLYLKKKKAFIFQNALDDLT